MSATRWIVKEDSNFQIDNVNPSLAAQIAADTDLPLSLARILLTRGQNSASQVQTFLSPKLSSLSDPFALPNMPAAVARILQAMERGERIVLYGDYDVDGVTSLSLMSRLLKAYGASVFCFLPQRIEEGYGLSHTGIKRCCETYQPQLLIAIDCGTSSATEIESLKKNGIDVIVFDHHECNAHHPLSPDVPLVNPKAGKDYHYLCSAGVIFKACHALLKKAPLPQFNLKHYLDIVALGTVADIVPLVEENRILVKSGLKQMEQTLWPGIRALLEVAGVKPRALKPMDIGYKLGPRLNAAGRLHTAEAALELLLTDDFARGQEIAVELNHQNRQRQELELQTLEHANEKLALLENFPDQHAAIVVGHQGWHPGVLGIVASRLMRKHHRPTFVIGFDETGAGKGSGRSIPGLSLVEALSQCSQWLEKFGGHEMAAGLSLQEKMFSGFQEDFARVARTRLTDEQLQPCMHIDCEVMLEDLTPQFLKAHELLQPFGMGNPQPVFLVRNVIAASPPRVIKEKHLKVDLKPVVAKGPFPPRIPAIFFNGANAIPTPPWDIAFQIEANEFQGRTTLQIHIQAMKNHDSSSYSIDIKSAA